MRALNEAMNAPAAVPEVAALYLRSRIQLWKIGQSGVDALSTLAAKLNRDVKSGAEVGGLSLIRNIESRETDIHRPVRRYFGGGNCCLREINIGFLDGQSKVRTQYLGDVLFESNTRTPDSDGRSRL